MRHKNDIPMTARESFNAFDILKIGIIPLRQRPRNFFEKNHSPNRFLTV